MRNILTYLAVLLSIFMLASCEKTELETLQDNQKLLDFRALPVDLCYCHTANLEHGSAQQFDVIGTMRVCNDEELIYIEVIPDPAAYSAIAQYWIYLGPCAGLPTNPGGNNLLFNAFLQPYKRQ